jgi:predicted ATP-grasp superfamily ATP-dependent carboligase
MAEVILIGASVRAAAFSAVRAGLRPWCVDLFADADLQAQCRASRIHGRYPDGFVDALVDAPVAPIIYTGGLENHPRLFATLAQDRPLWGNDADALRAARDPTRWSASLVAAGFSVPALRAFDRPGPIAKRFLVKPLNASGGTGVRFFAAADRLNAHVVLQEYIEGEARSAVFCTDGNTTTLLGATRQLVGETWLHAAPFQYCGSVGPLSLAQSEVASLERIGTTLARCCNLRGLFGVDGIWRDGVFWPVEVNPRYTASIEVLEYATGLAALAWHRRAFDSTAPGPALVSSAPGVVGKAILFAPAALTFAGDGPWTHAIGTATRELPAFADIPANGDSIAERRPIFTLLERGATIEDCLTRLRRRAAEAEMSLNERRAFSPPWVPPR